MLKTLAAITFSAAVAGAITGFPDIAPPVAATTTANTPLIAAATCPSRGWPYRDCSSENTSVRIVTTDRLH